VAAQMTPKEQYKLMASITKRLKGMRFVIDSPPQQSPPSVPFYEIEVEGVRVATASVEVDDKGLPTWGSKVKIERMNENGVCPDIFEETAEEFVRSPFSKFVSRAWSTLKRVTHG
jgi:hypothetical protein